ncbi:MAG: hypothetical protein J0J04_04920 [Microbacterium sp.]|uniref:hypothetical protein n=1 Tax=Microbacterium sp. TaxID=51671 RepID=UPI001AD556E6|nr:hypothetical protein [Microbacterium sp.]MBN9214150.1 hypothetical protein [Microbacterium sp.]
MSTFEALHPRAAAGKFTDKLNDPPTQTLSAAAPAEPVTGYLRLQAWGKNGLYELSTERIDVRAALDTYSLARVRTMQDTDDTEALVDMLRERGIITHDGPTDLDIYSVDFDEYIEQREEAGQHDAAVSQLIIPVSDAKARLDQLDAEFEALKARRVAAERMYLSSLAAEVAPDAESLTLIGETIYVRDTAGQITEAPREQAATIRASMAAYGISGGRHNLRGA